MLCLFIYSISCGIVGDILGDRRIASQEYVDKYILGNKTKVTSVGDIKEFHKDLDLRIDDEGKVRELGNEERRKEVYDLVKEKGLYVKYLAVREKFGGECKRDEILEIPYYEQEYNPGYLQVGDSKYVKIITNESDENYLRVFVSDCGVLSKEEIEILRIEGADYEEIVDMEDAEDVVPSMKYIKDNYVKGVDFGASVDRHVEDALKGNETYKVLVRDIVKNSLDDIGLPTKGSLESVDSRLQVVEGKVDTHIGVGNVVDYVDKEDVTPTTVEGVKIPTTGKVSSMVGVKVDKDNILKKEAGDRYNESDDHVYSAASSNERFVLASNIASQEEEDKEKVYSVVYINSQLTSVNHEIGEINKKDFVLRTDVVNIVEESEKFVEADNFSSKVVETVGVALAGDEEIRKSINSAIEEATRKLNFIVTKEQLVEDLDGLSSVYRSLEDLNYNTEGEGNDTLALVSYVDGKFKDEKGGEKYLLTANVKRASEDDMDYSVYSTSKVDSIIGEYAKIYDYDGEDGNAKDKKKVVRKEDLDAYVPTSSLVGYKKEEGVVSPEDEDTTKNQYSIPTLRKVEGMIIDSLTPEGGSTFVTSTKLKDALDGTVDDPTAGYVKKTKVVSVQSTATDEVYSVVYVNDNFALKPAEGDAYLAMSNVEPGEGEATVAGTKVPSVERAKGMASQWFDEKYEVVE